MATKKEWAPKSGDRVKFTTPRGRSGRGQILRAWKARNGSTWYEITEHSDRGRPVGRSVHLRRANLTRA